MNPKISGRWIRDEDELGGVESIVGFLDDVPSLTARCRSDGELLDVIDLRWEDGALKLDTVVPSSGYRGRWIMRFPTPYTCELEFTYWESWKRVPFERSETPDPP